MSVAVTHDPAATILAARVAGNRIWRDALTRLHGLLDERKG